MVFATLSSKSLTQSSASSNLQFVPSSVVFISNTVCVISDWSLLMVSMSFSCCCNSKFLEHPFNHFLKFHIWYIVWLHLIKLFFLKISPFIEACFPVSPLCLPLCVGFCVLGRSVMTPRLRGVDLDCRCPEKPSGTVSVITLAGFSRNTPSVDYVGPPVGIGFWCNRLSHGRGWPSC